MPTNPLYAPGLKRRARASGEARYWIPPAKDIAAGYPVKLRAIDADATELDAAALCRQWWDELTAWRDAKPKGPTKFTFAWLIERYLTDEFSKFHGLRHNSKRSYRQNCDVIKGVIGDVRVDGRGADLIIGPDILRWHKKWGRPDKDGKPTAPSRARHAIALFRILIKHAVMIRVPGSSDILTILDAMEFPTTKARRIVPDRAQVYALADKALAEGYRSIAITTLAQFELTERRISIIGTWENKTWVPGWQWSDVGPNWVIRYTQNKVGEVEREYDLRDTPRLLALLTAIPQGEREGAVVKCETTGQPWKERHYIETWRGVARRAGLPDTIWSMDMRAGGATEADAAGADDRDLKAAGGWKSDTHNRYTRAPQRRAQNVVRLRQKAKGE